MAAVFERTGRRAEAVAEYIATASILQRNGDLTRSMKTVEYATRLMPESQDARFALHTLRSNQLLPRPGKPKNIQLQNPVKTGETSKEGTGSEGDLSAKQNDPIEEARQRAIIQLAGLLFDQVDEPAGDKTARRGLNLITRGVSDQEKSASSKTSITLHLGQAIDSLSGGDENQAAVELEKALDLGLRQPSAYFILGLLTHNRDSERAQRFLQEAMNHPDYALGASMLYGQIYQAHEMFQEAAAAYLQALSLADAEIVGEPFADDMRQAYEPMIDALSSETDQALLQNISTTISSQLNRSDWRRFLLMARSQLPQSVDQPPLPVAEMILESRSGQVVEAVARVRELARRGLVRSSMEEAFYAIQFAPTYLPIHVQVGELLLQDGQNEDASS
jgi:tetratricopeptide (TPR) repeat protein